MKQGREKELVKKTAIITVGRISTQFVSFLLLPLYTALLSTKEYGSVDLVTTLVQLIIPITSLMIDQGVFRYLLNSDDMEEKRSTISSGFGVMTGFILVFMACYVPVCMVLAYDYKVWLMLILIVMSYSNLLLQIARGLTRTSDYALGSFVASAVTIMTNVICIAGMRLGANGMLAGTFLGNLLCCLFLGIRLNISEYISLSAFDWKLAKKEIEYSMPLIPNQLSLWVMNSSDRIVVSLIIGTAANGILAVSHKFPALYMTLFSIFQLAWHETGTVHYYDEDRDQFFSQMLEKVIAIFSTVCIGIIAALPIVFDWFVDSAYHEAYYNIPIYLIASLFNVLVGLLGVVYVATKKTSEIAKTTMMAAVINLIVILLLIRYIGLYAASISTFIGYLVTMIYRIVDTKKYLNISYNVRQYVFIFASLTVSCVIYYVHNMICSLVFLPICIIAAVIMNYQTIRELYHWIRNRNV